MGYFMVWDFVNICFVVYSYSATNFIFLFSWNFDIWFCLDFGVVLDFWDSNGLFFFGCDDFQNCFGVLSLISNFLFSLLPSILPFVFDLNLGYFGFFGGPNWLFLVVRVRFKNCFVVCSYCWTTFIFCVSFNSDFLFWPKFGVVFDFLGH